MSVEQCQQYYSGQAVSIIAHTDEGIRVAFPAIEIRKHMTHGGVYGRFEIVFDSDHKLVSLRKIG